MSIKPLSKLSLQDKGVAVQIKVNRKWEFRDNTDDGPIIHIDMVLSDAAGDVIYVEIPKDLLEEKASELQLNKIYTMKWFRVANARSSFKVVPAPLMIYLTPYTVIEICHDPPPTFPEYVYNLISYDAVDPYGPKNKDFHGDIYLGGGAACHWYFNPNILEAAEYYNRILSQEIKLELPLIMNEEISIFEPIIRQHKDLKYLLGLNPYLLPEEGCECTVTMTSIPEDNIWWYVACARCANKTVVESTTCRCSQCSSTESRLRNTSKHVLDKKQAIEPEKALFMKMRLLHPYSGHLQKEPSNRLQKMMQNQFMTPCTLHHRDDEPKLQYKDHVQPSLLLPLTP